MQGETLTLQKLAEATVMSDVGMSEWWGCSCYVANPNDQNWCGGLVFLTSSNHSSNLLCGLGERPHMLA